MRAPLDVTTMAPSASSATTTTLGPCSRILRAASFGSDSSVRRVVSSAEIFTRSIMPTTERICCAAASADGQSDAR